MAKYINFNPKPNPTGKTDKWEVISKIGDTTLGEVRWYSSWRKYCFFPYRSMVAYTVFEQDCLRDIANFIEEETKKYKTR